MSIPKPKQIVVLDDSSISRKMVARTLEHLGHQVHTAANAEQFWQLVERTPDVIFLDMNMPDIGGDELCQQLRRDARFAKLPIILLSSMSDDQLQAICTRVGASGYVSKQRGLETLQRYVHRLVEQELI